MGRKIKIAIATLLGFSTACSSVKNTPKQKEEPQPEQTVKSEQDSIPPRMKLMYGVPSPDGRMAIPLEEVQTPSEEAQDPAQSEKE